MHAGAQDPVRFRGIGIGELGEREGGLHGRAYLHCPRRSYTPAHIRPGLSTPLGSKLALMRFVNAATAASWGENTCAAARAAAGAWIKVAWPPVAATAWRTTAAPASSRASSASQMRPPAQS